MIFIIYPAVYVISHLDIIVLLISFGKPKKQDRLLGTGEKIGLVSEILDNCNKKNILKFFADDHHESIRNSFFHAAYNLIEDS